MVSHATWGSVLSLLPYISRSSHIQHVLKKVCIGVLSMIRKRVEIKFTD